ncbi:peptidase T [Calycomorphotria hydatis]|uniref:Peptidase T n=1 Tax=Calycomorphotria hydatis TaxID=2528027 RepID=A0A517TBA3_9PLAN|nr:peptidase T [Calycomorphotria hydatis]QDT65659.1 Peptidase T [Calycomorphotria hydatis]
MSTTAGSLESVAVEELLERFLKYVKIDTRADETSDTAPSTAKQLNLSKLLAEECRELGLADVELTSEGIVYATVPATSGVNAPTISWVAHVDTSPEYTADHVQPIVHRNYDGGDIVLPGAARMVIKADEHPALQAQVGGTVITSDGSTLLGADDKSGVAVMMTAAKWLLDHPEIVHGPIRLCFTTDEEIGRGCVHIDLEKLDSVCAYTLDSEGAGRIDVETFSADQAVVTITGINTHPSIGKGVMVNAVKLLAEFITRLPNETDSPETTDGRDGFLHPYVIEGGVPSASARILLRDFEEAGLQKYAAMLKEIAEQIQAEEPRAKVDVSIRSQYRNMRDGLEKEPRAVPKAVEAMRALGCEPRMAIIRGGTDGSQLTAMGLPTPNLSSGQHNPHSPLEWASLEEMQQAANVLIELAKGWGQEST